MRQVCLAIADWLRSVDAGDPLQIGFALEWALPAMGQQVATANNLLTDLAIPLTPLRSTLHVAIHLAYLSICKVGSNGISSAVLSES
jgi:hypothetical protein